MSQTYLAPWPMTATMILGNRKFSAPLPFNVGVCTQKHQPYLVAKGIPGFLLSPKTSRSLTHLISRMPTLSCRESLVWNDVKSTAIGSSEFWGFCGFSFYAIKPFWDHSLFPTSHLLEHFQKSPSPPTSQISLQSVDVQCLRHWPQPWKFFFPPSSVIVHSHLNPNPESTMDLLEQKV